MDFANLDLRETATKLYWVQLRVNETPLEVSEGKPCRVQVASATEPGVEAALKAVERAARSCQVFESQLATANRQDRVGLEKRANDADVQAEKAVTNLLKLVVKNWENIVVNGKELPFSQDALEDMAQPKAPLFRLAQNLAKDMADLYDPFTNAESD